MDGLLETYGVSNEAFVRILYKSLKGEALSFYIIFSSALLPAVSKTSKTSLFERNDLYIGQLSDY